ncbi:MAG: L,D-transpeptidase family protein [Coxiellaceae bacterium]|jgi:L,D-transpeptidase ErfK/SrfK|nr:L,D-transpeptidase family protein [Coxiellaceae bacterium]
MVRALTFVFIFIWPGLGFGLTFVLPKAGNDLVGESRVAQVKSGENLSDVALRFDVGYYEMFEANPGVDPDNPPVNTVLIVPTQYILPQGLKKRENIIVINVAEMRLYYRRANKVYIYPVGIGKEDWETPLGDMTIVRKVKNPTWHVPKSIYKFREAIGDKISRTVPPGPDNPLGRYALYLSVTGSLIHGTNLYSGVGRRSSAGCIRLYERDIAELYSLVTVGTKVIIINKPYKAGWSDKKLYLEAHMPLFEQRLEMGDDMKPALDVVTEATTNHKVIVDWKEVYKIAKEHLVIPRIVRQLSFAYNCYL